jgi:pimeloyl-ACP methyl ester carboxylesterase
VSRAIVPPKLAAKATLRFQVGPKGVAAKVHHDPELIACGIRRDQMPALIDVLDDMDAYGELDSGWSATVPLCTIWGAQNHVLSPRAGGMLGTRLQPDRAVTLGGCGHLPMLEDPAAVTAIIEEFDRTLDELRPTTELPS